MPTDPQIKTPPDKKSIVSFEDSLGELEQIVARLEAGERPLDESLALYEKGVTALKQCHLILDRAEKRIRRLVQGPNGEPVLQDSDTNNGLNRAKKEDGRSTDESSDSGGSLFGNPK